MQQIAAQAAALQDFIPDGDRHTRAVVSSIGFMQTLRKDCCRDAVGPKIRPVEYITNRRDWTIDAGRIIQNHHLRVNANRDRKSGKVHQSSRLGEALAKMD